MKPFTERQACQSREFCQPCRTDAAWRAATGAPAACPHGVDADHLPSPQKAVAGPGTRLKLLLSKARILAPAGCACAALEKEMNKDGPEVVLARIEYYADRLVENAGKHALLKRLPVPLAKLGALELIRAACRAGDDGETTK